MALVSIAKATFLHDVWQNFYNLMEDNITSVTLSDSTTSTIQTRTGAFPDSVIDDKTDYPIIVINTPVINWDDLTMGKKYLSGTIAIEIYSTKAEASDRFVMKIIDTVETNKDDLREKGLQFINLRPTSNDEFFRGKLKIHVSTANIEFKYVYTATRVW